MTTRYWKLASTKETTIIEFLTARGEPDPHINETCTFLSEECPKLRRLAAKYVEHPDYRERWLP